MKPKEISISVSRTFNIGNYESLRIEATHAVSLDEGDDLNLVRAMLMDEIRASMRCTWEKFKPKERIANKEDAGES